MRQIGILIFTLFLIAQIVGQNGPRVQTFYVPVVARLCGNIQVPAVHKVYLINLIEQQGCNDMHLQYVPENDSYFGYGTKVLRGE